MMLRILTCFSLVLCLGCLTGCKDGEIDAILSHITGGASIAVDPVTGAITPGVAVNIKDSTGRTLYRAEAGVPVTRDQVRALVRRGARSIAYAPATRYVVRGTTSLSPTQFSRYVVGDRVVEEDVCGTRSIVRAASLADSVDLEVTPSMREQFRNIILFRDRRYIRNSRPVERVIERAQAVAACYAPAEVVTIPAATSATPTIPEPTGDVTFGDIPPSDPKRKAVNPLDARVTALEGQVASLLVMTSRIEAKIDAKK